MLTVELLSSTPYTLVPFRNDSFIRVPACVEHLIFGKIQDLRRMPRSCAFAAWCRIAADNGDIVSFFVVTQIDRALPFDRSLLLGVVLKLHFGRSTRSQTAHELSCFFGRKILWVAILERRW